METIKINHQNDESSGFFQATENGIAAGKMSYVWAGSEKFIIDHTEVSPAFNGRGIGKQLLTEAVNYARKNNLKIIPLCPFAKSVFDKTASINDVLFH